VSLFRGSEWQEHERIFALANVVVISLASIGIAMLAASLLVHLSAPATWRICSAVFAVGWALGSLAGLRGYRRRTGQSLRADSPLLFAGAALVSLLGIALLAWNVLAPAAPRASLRFLLALELQLGVAGYLFIFAVFVPSSRDGGSSPSAGGAV
jgi:hypothetical protein